MIMIQVNNTNNNDNISNDLIKICDDLYTYKNSANCYPYTVHPSIWKTESIIKMFKTYPNSIYRNFEVDVSDYVNSNLNVFRLAYSKNALQSNGCKLSPFFQHIHRVNFRLFNHYDDFFDLRESYIKLVKDYNLDMTKRRMRRWDESV